MSIYTATVIKTGNSLALRIPKEYAQAAKLIPGEKVTLPLPTKQKKQNRVKLSNLLINFKKYIPMQRLQTLLHGNEKRE